MKKFEIPSYFRSSIISRVKEIRKLQDPRKKDFSPSRLRFDKVEFLIARHFGFCYGVENAIEIAYKALDENPTKKIYLLSQMIHNPGVNEDLLRKGVKFIQDTEGVQLISWDEITNEDIVIIPAFGTTIETEALLAGIGVNIHAYNTTCPFVEKVWNRSEKLASDNHTIIIHGKYDHEETRATFSHSSVSTHSLIIKNKEEAHYLSDYLLGKYSDESFLSYFSDKYTQNFHPSLHLKKIGVVNQTTMLASETEEITELLRNTMIKVYGVDDIKNHIADTKDTLCYATNDNQSSTYGLMEADADLAIVIGGYNSSNTIHLVELLDVKFTTFFIKSEESIISKESIVHFNIHTSKEETVLQFLPSKRPLKIIITSGASCPDSIVDAVIQKILNITDTKDSIEIALDRM